MIKQEKVILPIPKAPFLNMMSLNCVWQHRSWGTPADPEYPWSFKLFGDKGTLSASTMKYDFVPARIRKKRSMLM